MAAAVASPRADVCDALAVLLAYPDEGYAARAAAAGEALARHAPAACATAGPFLAHVAATPRAELEERYARTFDWSPTCCLEVGWHLFGERYERGAFLADMRASLRASGIERRAGKGTEAGDDDPSASEEQQCAGYGDDGLAEHSAAASELLVLADQVADEGPGLDEVAVGLRGLEAEREASEGEQEAVACHRHGTGVAGFLPRSWDHLDSQSWDRPACLVGGGLGGSLDRRVMVVDVEASGRGIQGGQRG